MRSKAVRSLALALLLGGFGMSAAQPPGAPPGGSAPGSPGGPRPPRHKAPPEKSKLEEMLAEALRNNPDIRVAAAKLAEAEAELNRTRVQVTQQVATLYQATLSQKAVVDYAQKKYDRMKGLLADRAIDARLVEEESDKLMAAKAKLAELEAQMPGLLGKTTRTEDSADAVRAAARLMLELTGQQPDPNALELFRYGLAGVVANPHKTTGPMAERLRKALQTPVEVNCSDALISDVLRDLQKKAPGLSFYIRDVPQKMLPMKTGARIPQTEDLRLTLHFDMPLPIAAILQAIEDQVSTHFIVRDYGILVTSGGLPPGAVTVQEFMRQKTAEK